MHAIFTAYLPKQLRHYLFIFLLLAGMGAHAQVLKGVVMDTRSGNPLSTVTVVNMTTQQSVYTNEEGEFSISGKSGQQIAFSYLGYKTVQRTMPPTLNIANIRIEMIPLNVELDELVIRPGMTDYQIDSAERRSTYSRVLARQKVISIMSPVSLIADMISKKSKRAYAFQKSFYYWENQLFIDSRYTPELVSKMTGLHGDTLAHFMNTYPMPVDYARTATELELKMWIRYNYKLWMNKSTDSLQIQTTLKR
jgi:hypothetical protein